MRKITSEAKYAFENGYDYNNTNTEVIDGSMFLFGNKIAEYASLFKNDGIKAINITNAGWPTTTTRERLNALEGVHIIQKVGVWYLNGREWDGEWVNMREWDFNNTPCMIAECKNVIDSSKTKYCFKHLN